VTREVWIDVLMCIHEVFGYFSIIMAGIVGRNGLRRNGDTFCIGLTGLCWLTQFLRKGLHTILRGPSKPIKFWQLNVVIQYVSIYEPVGKVGVRREPRTMEGAQTQWNYTGRKVLWFYLCPWMESLVGLLASPGHSAGKIPENTED